MIEARKAWRTVRRIIEGSDLVLEVLDARDPVETRNRRVEALSRRYGRPLLVVLNKVDLVPFEVALSWKKHLGREWPTIFISAKHRMGTRRLYRWIKMLAPRLPAKVAVVGYPNVGKSTIINYLKGRHAAGTSPMPGFTRGEMLVAAKSWLYVMDTPGVVPPEEATSEELLVIKGAVGPHELDDPVPPAISLIKRILYFNPRAFRDAYNIWSTQPEQILEAYGKARGLMLRGGRVNLDAAARGIIKDWIRGKLSYHYPPPE